MAPNQQTLLRIQALQDMRLADGYLLECYLLSNEENNFFADIILIFATEVCTLFGKMDAILKEETMDFEDLIKQCMMLIDDAASCGAIRIKNACLELREAANDPDNRSREWCFLKLDKVKCEYAALKPHLVEILQLEGVISDKHKLDGYAAF